MLLEESPLPSTVWNRPLAPGSKPWEGVGARLEWVHALVNTPVLTHTHTDTYTCSHVTTHSHSYTAIDILTQSRCGNSPGFRNPSSVKILEPNIRSDGEPRNRPT